jgi:hypothetical protein
MARSGAGGVDSWKEALAMPGPQFSLNGTDL